ncbi:RNA polymerase sigma-54 factor RpoN [Salinispira pacifica]|uniref:RNA polymerase sigma-54 factor RpoN n=1 Tax=Salinispira pacifica TaxID=1307761 RepID=V5WDJ2_9SPIO|nr:RNA polymerase sigma-54 factor RpoN [Salinispira pacifica]
MGTYFLLRAVRVYEPIQERRVNINIESYYEKYAPMVYRRCLGIVKNDEAAQDIMQDVFVNLLRFQNRLEHKGPSSLLYTMATNLSLNYLRSQKLRQHAAVEDQDPGWIDPSGETVLARHFLERLFAIDDDKTRIIAWLHYVDKYTLEETASHVGMSVSGIRKRLRKLQSRGKALKEA